MEQSDGATYGQLKDGKRISFEEFEKEVASKLIGYILIEFTQKHIKLCRKLYNKGYSVSDAVSYLILNS